MQNPADIHFTWQKMRNFQPKLITILNSNQASVVNNITISTKWILNWKLLFPTKPHYIFGVTHIYTYPTIYATQTFLLFEKRIYEKKRIEKAAVSVHSSVI